MIVEMVLLKYANVPEVYKLSRHVRWLSDGLGGCAHLVVLSIKRCFVPHHGNHPGYANPRQVLWSIICRSLVVLKA